MTRLDESFATLRQLGATYAGTMTLVRWAESERGRTATFRLDDGPDADAVHPFKGLPAHPKDGQRFKALLIMVADVAEEPQPAPPPDVVAEGVQGDSSPAPSVSAEKRRWREMKFAQRAALLCNDPVFWQWLNETEHLRISHSDDAAYILRLRVGVLSRAEFDTNPDAAERYAELESRFLSYKSNGEHMRSAAQ